MMIYLIYPQFLWIKKVIHPGAPHIFTQAHHTYHAGAPHTPYTNNNKYLFTNIWATTTVDKNKKILLKISKRLFKSAPIINHVTLVFSNLAQLATATPSPSFALMLEGSDSKRAVQALTQEQLAKREVALTTHLTLWQTYCATKKTEQDEQKGAAKSATIALIKHYGVMGALAKDIGMSISELFWTKKGEKDDTFNQ